MSRSARNLFLALMIGFSLAPAYADRSDPASQNHLAPSPAESGIPEKISRKEARGIRREFTAILDQERDQLRADQNKKRKDGDASRKQRKHDWDTQERIAREKFFQENAHGPDRRQYVYAFNERRKVFYEQLKSEERKERAGLDADWKALKDLQRARLNSVEECLGRSERPAPELLRRVE
jgi:hypothetical protein